MGRISLLLGKSRWRRIAALPASFRRPDALGRAPMWFVTETHRQRSQLVDRPPTAGHFQPSVHVLNGLFDLLWMRFGDGRALLSERTETLVAERLIRQHPGRWPWLEALGPLPIGAQALVSLRTRLGECGLQAPPVEARRAVALREALRALDQALTGLQAGVGRTDATALLRARLEAPTEPLNRWLRIADRVSIEVLQPTPLRTAALIALVRAWAAQGTEVVIHVASGRDLGGREAGPLFGFDFDDVEQTANKAFGATHRYRTALFESLVASGEASLRVATSRGLVEVEPGGSFEPPAAADLSDHLFTHTPIPVETVDAARSWCRGLRFVECADHDAELRWIAQQVRQALDDGISPQHCVVAWPDLEDAARVRAAFDDVGVSVAIGGGQALARAPITSWLRAVLRLSEAGWPVADLLSLADSLDWPLAVPANTLRTWCDAAGLRTGRPARWAEGLTALLNRTEQSEALEDLSASLATLEQYCEWIETLSEPAPPRAWQDALWSVCEQLGFFSDSRHSSARRAWSAIDREIEALVRDLECVDRRPWPTAQLHRHLDQALATARWLPRAPDAAAVQFVGLLELRGLTPTHLWIGGLVRGRFPSPSRPDPLLEPTLVRRLRRVDPVAEARYLLGEAVRAMMEGPGDRTLVLSWPKMLRGRFAPPTPALAEILATPTTHPEGKTLGDLVAETAPSQPPILSRSSRVRAATITSTWAPRLDPPDQGRLRRHQERAAAEAEGSQAWSGVLSRPTSPPTTLAVSTVEQLVKCPARYWYEAVLGLVPPDPWSHELEPQRRGTAMHRILQRFLESRGLATLSGADFAPAARALFEVAGIVLDQIEDEGGFEPAMQAWARGRWLAGLVDEQPAGVLAAWLRMEIDADPALIPLAVEAPIHGLELAGVSIRGRLDRLDRTVGGALLVTDYKTGAAPAATRVAEGLALQPLIYTEAARAQHPGHPIAAAYLPMKRADGVRRRTWSGDPAAIEQFCDPRQRTHAVPLDPVQRADQLDRTAAAIRAVVAGRVPTTAHGPARAGCVHCPHARICRVRHASQVLDPDPVS